MADVNVAQISLLVLSHCCILGDCLMPQLFEIGPFPSIIEIDLYNTRHANLHTSSRPAVRRIKMYMAFQKSFDNTKEVEVRAVTNNADCPAIL